RQKRRRPGDRGRGGGGREIEGGPPHRIQTRQAHDEPLPDAAGLHGRATRKDWRQLRQDRTPLRNLTERRYVVGSGQWAVGGIYLFTAHCPLFSEESFMSFATTP